MDLGDSATQRRVGIAANAVGLVLLGAFILFGNRLFGAGVVGWVTFAVAVVLTGLGIALIRISDR
ncbi:MAG: hypothetical protein V5A39_09025 [Haloarculaceae archaeon]